MKVLCVTLCTILLLSFAACCGNQAVLPEKEADIAPGWPKTPEGLLEHLNSWDKDVLDKCERPEVYPNYKDTGETQGWIYEHKEEFAKMGVKIRWNAEEMRYEMLPSTGILAQDEKKKDALEVLKAHLKLQPCGCCGNTMPWGIQEIKHNSLAKYLKGCRFFLCDWICCQDKPVSTIIIGISLNNEKVFRADGHGDQKNIDNLKQYLKLVESKDEALEVADIVAGFAAYWSWELTRIQMTQKQQVKVLAGGGYQVTGEYCDVEFDGQGKLKLHKTKKLRRGSE